MQIYPQQLPVTTSELGMSQSRPESAILGKELEDRRLRERDWGYDCGLIFLFCYIRITI